MFVSSASIEKTGSGQAYVNIPVLVQPCKSFGRRFDVFGG